MDLQILTVFRIKGVLLGPLLHYLPSDWAEKDGAI
jgi:hypothetical protein